MDNALEPIFKSFTRYFMPGLIFVSFSFIVPFIVLLEDSAHSILNDIPLASIVLSSLVFGYLLDSAGAYRWTFHYKEYVKNRSQLSSKLKDMRSKSKYHESESTDDGDDADPDDGDNADPDVHISLLFINKERVYDRIFVERSKWVLVLESAFALISGAVVVSLSGLLIWYFCTKPSSSHILYKAFTLAPIYLCVSGLVSRKGVQRMKAHNSKLLEAMRLIYETEETR